MSNVFKGQALIEAQEGLLMQGQSRNFKVLVDEPEALGGSDQGMNPIELLLNAIGSCKGICVRLFAQQKGIQVRGLKILVEGSMDLDGLMQKNDQAKLGLYQIHTHYYLESDASDQDLQELVDFVDQACPVMDTITNPPQTITSDFERLEG